MESSQVLLTFGSIFLLGLLAELIGNKIRLPRVTILIIFGIIIGPACFNLIPTEITQWYQTLTEISLSMIGFLIGGKITWESIKDLKKYVIITSTVIVISSFVIVFFGTWLIGLPIAIALILAALSTAAAPTITTDVIYELNAKGKFRNILLDIVVINEIWCLVIFSVILVCIQFLSGHFSSVNIAIFKIIWSILGAILIGVIFGIPMAYLSGRVKLGEPIFLEAVGIVFTVSAIALLLNVSFILTMIVLGMTVTNLAKHHKSTFHAIKGIEWPFLVIFFTMGGAMLKIDFIHLAEVTGLIYILLYIFARLFGAWLGCVLVQAENSIKYWLGPALIPQGGLVIGLALIASHEFPIYSDIILPIILLSCVVFEIIGPIFTKKALQKNEMS